MNPLAKTTFLSLALISIVSIFGVEHTQAQYGSCSEYGVMAYESGGYCKCMSGYVMGDDFMGNSRCVSGDSVCSDKYGYGSDYDSLSGSCECRYGYVFGKDSIGRTQCITDDQACENQLGYNSSASFGGQCKCDYGYIIDGGECENGDSVCRSDHGMYASYNSLSNACECDDDYTFDDSEQCVEKQHNVYFKLLDINHEDDKELLIKSEYDSRKYIVRLGVGCLSTSIERYAGKNLVVNLGTDYEVDTWDTVVLQDHDQTCSIVSKERTYDDSFPEPEEVEESFNYQISPTFSQTPTIQVPEKAVIDTTLPETANVSVGSETGALMEITSTSTDFPTTTDSYEDTDQNIIPSEPKESIFKRVLNFFKNLF